MSKVRVGNPLKYLGIVLLVSVMSGCASNQMVDGEPNPDPLEPANRTSYSFNDTLDKALLEPVAEAYANVAPEPVRKGVTNFFDNIYYLNVVLNSLLQGKFGQFLSDVGRVVTNTTLGIGGLFDVATGMGMEAHNEDFGQTLASWGVDRGAYLYIPLVKGPDTVRNLPNLATSALLSPLTYLNSIVLWPASALNIINTRANLLDDTSIRDEAAIDPYAFTREAFLQQREFLIHDGNPPAEDYDELFDELEEDDPSLRIE